MISPNGFQIVQHRSASLYRTGGETRLTSTTNNQQALTSSRRLITRLVARISDVLAWVAETSIAFHPQPIGLHGSSDFSRRISMTSRAHTGSSAQEEEKAIARRPEDKSAPRPLKATVNVDMPTPGLTIQLRTVCSVSSGSARSRRTSRALRPTEPSLLERRLVRPRYDAAYRAPRHSTGDHTHVRREHGIHGDRAGPDRRWIVLSSEHRTVALEDGPEFIGCVSIGQRCAGQSHLTLGSARPDRRIIQGRAVLKMRRDG